MQKMIIKICAHTLPFAAKIRDVAPINAAANVKISIFIKEDSHISLLYTYHDNIKKEKENIDGSMLL